MKRNVLSAIIHTDTCEFLIIVVPVVLRIHNSKMALTSRGIYSNHKTRSVNDILVSVTVSSKVGATLVFFHDNRHFALSQLGSCHAYRIPHLNPFSREVMVCSILHRDLWVISSGANVGKFIRITIPSITCEKRDRIVTILIITGL